MSEKFVDCPRGGEIVRLIAEAEAGDIITIMRDDEPVAVIIGAAEFDRLTAAVEALAR